MGAQKTRKGKPGYDPDADDDEGPVREVAVAPFQIGRYPVTVQEFKPFVEDEDSGYRSAMRTAMGEDAPPQPEDWEEQILHPNRPVVNVNWFVADAYCKWLTAESAKTPLGRTYRLPSEEEWEFAARGKEGRKYPWGNEPPDINRANYDDSHIGAPTPIGLFPNGSTPPVDPSPFGIDDMAGNVWEWTADWYDNRNDTRVVRGGCWNNNSTGLRAASRVRNEPGVSFNNSGFRVGREA